MKTQKTTAKQNLFRSLGLFTLCMLFSLLANPMFAQEQERTVTGVVTSVDGPLLGASVVLKGTSYGVMTNDLGEFTFPELLKQDDVLVISYLGYETSEVTIKGSTTFINPSLKDIPVVIIAALRTNNSEAPLNKQ